jgi:hypothetical protein
MFALEHAPPALLLPILMLVGVITTLVRSFGSFGSMQIVFAVPVISVSVMPATPLKSK